MTIIDVTDQHSMEAVVCHEGGNDFRPVDVFDDLKKIDFRPEADPSSLSSYPTTHGYFYRAHDDRDVNYLLEKLSQHNPRAKVMLSITGIDLAQSKKILRVAYENFKMLRVVTTSLRPKHERKSANDHMTILCSYNPFSGNSSTRLPEFRCFYFALENFFEELTNFGNFLKSKTENLQGFPLKISIFKEEMKSVPVCGENGEIMRFKYADGELVSTLAKVINFTPIYETISDDPKQGSFAESLEAVEQGKVDFVANSMLIANYNTNNSVFVLPITMTKLNFIVKKRFKRKALMMTIFEDLHWTAQIVACSFCVCLPFIYCFVHKMEIYATRRKEKIDVIKYLLYVIALQVSVAMRQSSMTASRILVASILFYAMIINAIFQGTITKDMNSNENIAKITKIDQLLDQNFTISMQPVLTYAFQHPGPNRVTKHLNKVAQEILSVDPTPEKIVLDRLENDSKLAFLWTDVMTGTFLNNFYNNETGENHFEVVPEIAFEFYAAMMIPKSSPFFERFNSIINVYVQAGLYLFDTQRALNDNEKVWIRRLKLGHVPKFYHRPITIYDMHNALKTCLALIAVSFIVFLGELYISFRKRQ